MWSILDGHVSVYLHQPALFYTEMATRMPFRYGIATMTRLPHLFFQCEVVTDQGRALGQTADHLPPKWFKKDPQQHPRAEIDEMLRVVRHAISLAEGLEADTPFALWQELYRRQAAWGRAEGLPPLLANFGVALVEKALLDGWCRAQGTTLATAIRAEKLGLALEAIHPELAGSTAADWLPPAPLTRIHNRHTVGLLDPLRETDIAAADRLNDGLPQSLQAAVAAYGLTHFKLKIAGAPESDIERLRAIAGLLDEMCAPDYAVTIDGNEGYLTAETFLEFARLFRQDRGLETMRSRLLFLEQPFHREVALSEEVRPALRSISPDFAVIIDESDAELGSLPRALELGYRGTSHKNCKGIFKGIANACLLRARSVATPGEKFFMSGEDLSNVAPLALPQDLAMQALLGNESVERNGQHYFHGLSQLPEALQETVLAHHPDLFSRRSSNLVTLAIQGGRLELGSVNAAPFGFSAPLDLAAHFQRLEHTGAAPFPNHTTS